MRKARFNVTGTQENEIIASNVDTSSTNLHRWYYKRIGLVVRNFAIKDLTNLHVIIEEIILFEHYVKLDSYSENILLPNCALHYIKKFKTLMHVISNFTKFVWEIIMLIN